jgi:hypothetical protein
VIWYFGMEWTVRSHESTDYRSIIQPAMCDFSDDSRLYTFPNLSTAEPRNWAAPARACRYEPSWHGSTDRPSQYKSHKPGYAPPAKLGRTLCRAGSLRPSTSVGIKKVTWCYLERRGVAHVTRCSMSSSESRLCSTMMKGFRLATFKQNAGTLSWLKK